MVKSIYLNLEDDVAHITAKLKRALSDELVLVVPKKSLLFSDSINLRLLKKQADLLGKKVAIMTMDETGQMYAKEAGFALKHISKTLGTKRPDDIRMAPRRPIEAPTAEPTQLVARPLRTPVVRPAQVVKRVVKKAAPIIPAARVAIKDTVFPQTAKQTKPDLFKPHVQQELSKARRTTSAQRMILAFVAASIAIILVVVFVLLPHASITVYAKTQPVSRDIDVLVSAQVNSPDQARLTLPSTKIQRELVVSNRFDTIGKKDFGTKAEGTVKVFNLTGKALNLRAGTTTLTAGGKTYRFKTDQNNIRASANATTTPNIAPIEAIEGGEAYNLPAGTRVEITNQVFGAQPQVLYAVVDTPVVGGSSRFISVVTEEDHAKAQEALVAQAVTELRDELKQSNILLPEKAFTTTAADFVASAPVAAEVPTFTSNLKVAISGLAFNSLDLATMMRQRIIATLGKNVNLQDASKDTVTYLIKDLDVGSGTMRLTVHYESKAVGQVDLSDVSNQIVGKSKEQASEILLANEQIDRVDIVLSPTWQRSVPSFKQKISIEVK